MSGDSTKTVKTKSKRRAKELDAKPVVGGAKPELQPKKKKKNPPDRPQPAWLFPPDEENPVLNPKVLTEAEKKKLYDDRIAAIRFLRYKSTSAPLRTAPPGLLLTLIGAFLGTYGFNSTSRLFTLECNARKKLDGWEEEIGKKLEKGMPDLVKIFKDWSKEWHERRELGMTSSDSEDDTVTKRAKMVKKRESINGGKAGEVEDSTSTGGSDGSDSGSGGRTRVKTKASKNSAKAVKAGKSSPSSGSLSSSASESDADDEKDTKVMSSSKPSTMSSLVNKLKRKAPSSPQSAAKHSSESSSNSSSSGTSDSEAPANKRIKDASGRKVAVHTIDPKSNKASTPVTSTKATSSDGSSSSSSNSSASDSGSDVSSVRPAKEKRGNPVIPNLPSITNGRQSSSDSSTTLKVTSPDISALQKAISASSPSSSASSSSSDSSTSDSEASPKKSKKIISKANNQSKGSTSSPKPAATEATAKVHKKTNTPFSRIPQNIKVDPKLASNAYVPYDYAEKAHQDLSVTKGKGFTKEKNKKKRGAYRGGAIDVSGGKGIKFD